MNSNMLSLGSQPIVDKLDECINTREYPADTILLNLGTLVRNCSSNEVVKQAIEEDKERGLETLRPGQVLYTELINEMNNMIEYICQLFNNNTLVHNPTIITYFADYSAFIPEDVYRKPTDSKRAITICNQMIIDRLKHNKKQAVKLEKVTVREVPMLDTRPSWRWLYDVLGSVKNNHDVIMISHHPSDYHIGPYCRTFRVLRSYTGKVIWYKDLNDGIFGTSSLPFNQYTHAILGDKEDIKPSIRGASKDTLLEIAENEEWSLKTQEYIYDKLYRMNIRIPIKF